RQVVPDPVLPGRLPALHLERTESHNILAARVTRSAHSLGLCRRGGNRTSDGTPPAGRRGTPRTRVHYPLLPQVRMALAWARMRSGPGAGAGGLARAGVKGTRAWAGACASATAGAARATLGRSHPRARAGPCPSVKFVRRTAQLARSWCSPLFRRI